MGNLQVLGAVAAFIADGGAAFKEQLLAKKKEAGREMLAEVFRLMKEPTAAGLGGAYSILTNQRSLVLDAMCDDRPSENRASVEADLIKLCTLISTAIIGLPYLEQLEQAIQTSDAYGILAAVGWDVSDRRGPRDKNRYGAAAAAYACLSMEFGFGVWGQAYNVLKESVVDVAFSCIDEFGEVTRATSQPATVPMQAKTA